MTHINTRKQAWIALNSNYKYAKLYDTDGERIKRLNDLDLALRRHTVQETILGIENKLAAAQSGIEKLRDALPRLQELHPQLDSRALRAWYIRKSIQIRRRQKIFNKVYADATQEISRARRHYECILREIDRRKENQSS